MIALAAAALGFHSSSAGAQIFNDAEAEMRVLWMQMERDAPRHPNPAVQRFAECIAWSIIEVIPDDYQDLDWEIIVFDTPQINAMVTSEGKIAVFGGLLEIANNADKLAAVLGHEVAHLTQGHVHERVLRMAGTGLLGIAGNLLTGGLAGAGESQYAANILFQYPFQREQEREADIVGMEYMARAGYNPSSVLELWGGMAKAHQGQTTPEFLSTHPDPEYRRSDMARNLSPSLVIYNDSLDAGVRPRCRF